MPACVLQIREFVDHEIVNLLLKANEELTRVDVEKSAQTVQRIQMFVYLAGARWSTGCATA